MPNMTLAEHRKKYPGIMSVRSICDWDEMVMKQIAHNKWAAKATKWREEARACRSSGVSGS